MADQREPYLSPTWAGRLSIMLILCLLTALSLVVVPSGAPPPPPPNETPPFLALAAEPPVLSADGISTSQINASAWDGESWIWAGPTVNFSTDLGEVTPSAIIENGTATALLTAGMKSGVATVSAEAKVGWLGTLKNTTTVPFISVEFDTGAGAYPNIAGVHRGTIRPTHAVIVRKISAYPCTGTGGHIESAALYYAGEVIATASWHGYQDEYRTLSFSNEVVLDEGTEYQYEIVTGSYPMAIHQQENTTLDGSFINCTSFVDVNGNEYLDWIPSFWLGP
jgi:hypothetical protein